MKRNLQTLSQEKFDVLIVGGGIYGATVAWEAVLRGLQVALIDKGDFASGTSSNSLKIIHGGLRYLQHADIIRMRESIRERRILMQIAPHLVHPLPCVMPTYGHAIKGPEVMRIALLMNDIISLDRNRLKDPQKHLPAGRILSKDELLQIVPFIDKNNLTGGAQWYDAHMTNSERLVLSFIKSSVERGVQAANYVKAEQFVFEDGRVSGAQVRDVLNDDVFPIRAKIVVNTAGPWINNLLGTLNGKYNGEKIPYSTAINLVVNRRLSQETAFGAPSRFEFRDKDTLISRGSRLLFIVPWRNVSLVGTAHTPFTGDAEKYKVTEEEIEKFLREVNSALIGADIRREDVTFQYAGLLPLAGVHPESGDVQLEKHFKIYDHENEGVPGLVSVVSVKYTTARDVAEKAVKLLLNKLAQKAPRSHSDSIKIWGGEIEEWEKFILQEMNADVGGVGKESLRHLLQNYGNGYKQVLQFAESGPSLKKTLSPNTPILKAEIAYGVEEEMAQKLSDVVLRRTELGSAWQPSRQELEACAGLMAKPLGWSRLRIEKEIQEVEEIYRTTEMNNE
ncbi:MAG: glycerol-3-phosphate dehydrogenase/oxidase [Calditrichaeota bacterium]|nr:glycerol-3-phosphate dehydrogenase/oxidase [Calditrichota bacterium]